MDGSEITVEKLYVYFKENGCKVKNRDLVKHFKEYINHPVNKEGNRLKFKEYVNTLAHTRLEGDQKVLILKSKYLNRLDHPNSPSLSSLSSLPAGTRDSIGIPSGIPVSPRSSPREPPPYRHPPPPSPQHSLNSSQASARSTNIEDSDVYAGSTPQAPRRKRNIESPASPDPLLSPKNNQHNDFSEECKTPSNVEGGETQVSVKERTQKFNRLASVEEDLGSRTPKSAEKDKSKSKGGLDEGSGGSCAILQPLEQKSCVDWCVTASKGDFQELVKLAANEPRLANRKDPFTAYTVLHWGAKYGNADIIKVFAGTYKVDVNCKTNGGYTPLHISAQFGHKDLFKLLIEVYKADTKIRDYSGRTAEYYLLTKEKKKDTNTRTEYGSQRGYSTKLARKNKSFRSKHSISLPTSIPTSSNLDQ